MDARPAPGPFDVCASPAALIQAVRIALGPYDLFCTTALSGMVVLGGAANSRGRAGSHLAGGVRERVDVRLLPRCRGSALGRPWRPRLDARGRGAGAGDRAGRRPCRAPRPRPRRARRRAGGGRPPSRSDAARPDAGPVRAARHGGRDRASRARHRAGERVAIFGDYDVDGACGAALLSEFLAACGCETLIHIPDRVTEGYGPNVEAMRQFRGAGRELVVTVDCGAVELRAVRRGGAARPRRDRVRPPPGAGDAAEGARARRSQPAGRSLRPRPPCATGVVFMALVALNRALCAMRASGTARQAPDLIAELDLVALATVADVVPLTGLNRAFVARGLQMMRAARPAGPRGAVRRRRRRRAAEALSSRLPHRPAHQRRRPHRRCRARRAAAATTDDRGGARDRRRARPAEPRAPGNRDRRARGSRGRSAGLRSGSRSGARGGRGGRELAAGRRRPPRRAAEGAVRPARLRAGLRRRDMRPDRPLDRRRRSRRRFAQRSRRACSSRAAAMRWRPESRSRKRRLGDLRALSRGAARRAGRRARGPRRAFRSTPR